MKLKTIVIMAITFLMTAPPTVAKDAVDADALNHSVSELHTSVGHWAVTTQFLNDDGSTAKEV